MSEAFLARQPHLDMPVKTCAYRTKYFIPGGYFYIDCPRAAEAGKDFCLDHQIIIENTLKRGESLHDKFFSGKDVGIHA